MLDQLLEKVQDTLVGATVLPLGMLAVGVAALWGVTWAVRVGLDSQIAQARAREAQALQGGEGGARVSSWTRFLVRRGDKLISTLKILRWVGVVAIAFASIGEGLTQTAQVMRESGTGTAKVIKTLERFGGVLDRGTLVVVKLFCIFVLSLWTTRFLNDALLSVTHNNAQKGGPASRAHLRSETLNRTGGYVIANVVGIIALLSALQTVGINIAPLLATAGVASVAIGFGAQSLVRDVLAGFFILFEDQFALGDVIETDGKSGSVEAFTLRVTKLRTADGSLFVIPNGEIKWVKNLTAQWGRVDFRVGVPYDCDIDHALRVLEDEAKKLVSDFPLDVTADADLLGVDQLGDSSVFIRAWFKTTPASRWNIGREFNRRILKRLKSEGIGIPFPQREVWVHHTDETGAFKPLAARESAERKC